MTTYELGALGIAALFTLWALAGWIGLRAACGGERPSPDWLESWGEIDGA